MGAEFPTFAVNDGGDRIVAWAAYALAGSQDASLTTVVTADVQQVGQPPSAPQALSPPMTPGGWPHVALNSRGDAVVTWSEPVPGTAGGYYALRYAIRSSGGASGPVGTLEAAQQGALAADNAARPLVALDDAGRLTAVWDQGDTIYAATGDVAVGFGPRTRISDEFRRSLTDDGDPATRSGGVPVAGDQCLGRRDRCVALVRTICGHDEHPDRDADRLWSAGGCIAWRWPAREVRAIAADNNLSTTLLYFLARNRVDIRSTGRANSSA